jgi:hypothetical protein
VVDCRTLGFETFKVSFLPWKAPGATFLKKRKKKPLEGLLAPKKVTMDLESGKVLNKILKPHGNS